MLAIYCRTSKRESICGVSTIEQQEKAGVEFAKEKNKEYKIYKEKGKSGAKDFEDKDDFIRYRPDFANLLNDIASGLITEVWVWEQSRLSRNTVTFDNCVSYYFKKYNVILYIKNDRHDFNNPTDKLMLGIFSQFAEYERNLIISRTNRGKIEAFNKGQAHWGKLFGYIHTKGNKTEQPNIEELETAKNIFNEYAVEKKTLKEIAIKHFGKGNDLKELLKYQRKVKQILSHCEYTAESLNEQGRNIFNEFKKGSLENLNPLLKDDCWVKSTFYKEKIISRELFVNANERLEYIRRTLKKEPNYRNKRETNNSLASALLTCGICHNKYYYKNAGEHGGFIYKHLNTITKCKQPRKQITIEKIDSIMNVCFTYFYLMFDNTKDRIKEQHRELKAKNKKTAENINQLENERNKKQKLIKKLEDELESGDIENVSIIIKQMDRLTNELQKINENIEQQNIDALKTTAKENELSKAEEYQANTINTIRNWFNLVEKESYTDLRILWLANFKSMELNGDLITITPADTNNKHEFIFNMNYDYKIIYKFIEKIIGMEIKTTYTDTQENWIKEKADLINRYEATAKEYLINRQKRTERKTKALMQEQTKQVHELLSSPFHNFKAENKNDIVYYYLFTREQANLNSSIFFTTAQVAKMVNRTASTLKGWAETHGVKSALYSDGKRRLQWTEEKIDEYKNCRQGSKGRPIGKKSKATEKQLEHLKKIKGLNQTPEAKAKRAKSLKKYHREINK